MTSPLDAILESKRALRRELAALPVAEKLLVLDALRERDRTIRGADVVSSGAIGVDAERRMS
jgi:hypothetical protein